MLDAQPKSKKANILTGLLVSVLMWFNASLGHAIEPVYPGETWDRLSPGEVGMDGAELKSFSDFVGGRGCVIRHGYLVYSWGDISQRGDIASAAKPWYSHFLFVALERGKIGSLDERVSRWDPRLNSLNRPLSYKDRAINWRHLANQTSCYGVREAPGTAYDYNDWQMALFWDLLFQKVFGATFANVDQTVLHPLLTDILQCQDNPSFLAFGLKDRPGRTRISVRDFARFGLLYLRQGNWRGTQLIKAENAFMAVTSALPNAIPQSSSTQRGQEAEMIPGQRSIGSRRIPDNQTDHMGSYSWLWWTNGIDREGKRHWPGVPHDAYGAFGHGGPRAMVVIPSLDLVMSWNDARVKSREKEGKALKLLVNAVARHATDLNQGQERRSVDLGTYAKWQKIEIDLRGPDSSGLGQPNPFSVFVDAIFQGPSGQRYSVPGFYAGNGRGGLDGNVWRVRFSADEAGRWTYVSQSQHPQLNQIKGGFSVTPAAKDAPGFYQWGRLEYPGTAANQIRYLKFREGPYWLKAGCDDPENFLGNYRNYNTLAKRKAAVDYLAHRGINSIYMMTHNLAGDDKDVWPWLGDTARQAKVHGADNCRFDLRKMEEWCELFEYMQARAVVPYLVLEDDSAWKGYDHERYYRELIAHFGYLPGLLFNFNEEYNENYSLDQALAYMKLLQEIDPYRHPRGIHNVNTPVAEYIDAPQVNFTSIQTGSVNRPDQGDALKHNQMTLDWIQQCKARNQRILMVNFDEGRPELNRRAWWSAYLAGGVWEAHVSQPYDRPMSAWEPVWTELGGARAFVETLPFWEMQAHNELVIDGHAFCLAKPGQVYALYLHSGGSITVNLAPNVTYDLAWWDPANGKDGEFQNSRPVRGGRQRLSAPGPGDWALRIIRQKTP